MHDILECGHDNDIVMNLHLPACCLFFMFDNVLLLSASYSAASARLLSRKTL